MSTLLEQKFLPGAGGGAGRTGDAFRAGKWASSPLGPVASWPPRLCFALELMFAAGQPVFVCWGERHLLFHNDGCLDFGGGRIMLGQPLSEAWPEIAALLVPVCKRLRITGRGAVLEDQTVLLNPGGGKASLTFSCTPLNGEGEAGGMLVTCTEWRPPHPAPPDCDPEKSRLLAESESRLRAIIDFAPAAIYVKDLCFHYETANEHLLRLIGRNRREVEGRDDYALFPQETADLFRATDKDVLASGRPLEFEEEVMQEDGLHTYLTVKFPLVDELGNLYGLAGISTDMTERKQMEESLQARQRELRLILDAAPVAIIYVDSDQRYRFLNRAYSQRFGFAPEEIIGRSVCEVRGKKAYAAIRGNVEAVLSGREVRYEMSDRFEGEQRHWQVAYAPDIDAAGRVRGFIAVIDEITDRKRSEEKLQAIAEELARSNRELEQFAYVVSHDLREPLRTIGGFLNLIQRRYGGHLDHHARELIHYAVDGAGRMDRMITDLLDYSRVQRQEAVAEPVDLFEVWLAVIDNLRALIEETGAHIAHDPLPVITGDRAQLIRLLQNLLGNAIKFRGDRTPEIRIGIGRRKDGYLFSVRDNGIGIPPQSAERVFQVFQRLHTQKDYPGTGIGLAICKKIVERHGGRIWVESEPGEGTTFYFTLADRPVVGGRSH